ncbi:hypothetical protein HBI43_243440, partial [Parastagonospora nodorum]
QPCIGPRFRRAVVLQNIRLPRPWSSYRSEVSITYIRASEVLWRRYDGNDHVLWRESM